MILKNTEDDRDKNQSSEPPVRAFTCTIKSHLGMNYVLYTLVTLAAVALPSPLITATIMTVNAVQLPEVLD